MPVGDDGDPKSVAEWNRWRGEMNRSIEDLRSDIADMSGKFSTMEATVNAMRVTQAEANTKIRFGAFIGGLVGSGVITLIVAIATKSI